MGRLRVTKFVSVLDDIASLPADRQAAIRAGAAAVVYPYVFQWAKLGPERKGARCRVLARSKTPSALCRPVAIAGEHPAPPKNFNSILIEFEDGFTVVTSGNSIRKAPA